MSNIFTDTLSEALLSVGYEVINPPIGRVFRFGKKKNRWIKLFADCHGAVFGDWRTGESFVWQKRRDNRLTPSELETLQLKQAERQREALREEKIKHALTAEEANRLWDLSKIKSKHPYLANKKLKFPVNCLEGWLLIPIYYKGRLVNIQRINRYGAKRFLKGGRVKDCYSIIELNPRDSLYICEGYATGIALHKLTGASVVTALSAHNLTSVARLFRSWYPKRNIIIAGDDDRGKSFNTGREEANRAALAINGRIIFPTLKGGGGDFADMWEAIYEK